MNGVARAGHANNAIDSAHVSGQQLDAEGVANAVRDLAQQGLKVRDIASLLHIHPLIVLRLLDAEADCS